MAVFRLVCLVRSHRLGEVLELLEGKVAMSEPPRPVQMEERKPKRKSGIMTRRPRVLEVINNAPSQFRMADIVKLVEPEGISQTAVRGAIIELHGQGYLHKDEEGIYHKKKGKVA